MAAAGHDDVRLLFLRCRRFSIVFVVMVNTDEIFVFGDPSIRHYDVICAFVWVKARMRLVCGRFGLGAPANLSWWSSIDLCVLLSLASLLAVVA